MLGSVHWFSRIEEVQRGTPLSALAKGAKRRYRSFVTNTSVDAGPRGRAPSHHALEGGAMAGVSALLEHLGLSRYATRFETQSLDDLQRLADLAPKSRLRLFSRELGMAEAEARRL